MLVQKLLRAVEAEKQGLKNRVWPYLGEFNSGLVSDTNGAQWETPTSSNPG